MNMDKSYIFHTRLVAYFGKLENQDYMYIYQNKQEENIELPKPLGNPSGRLSSNVLLSAYKQNLHERDCSMRFWNSRELILMNTMN